MKPDIIEIKKIVATFTKLDVETINSDTVIDKTAVQGSILIHRMYAELANAGLQIENYTEIKTFGELLNMVNLTENSTESSEVRKNSDDTDADSEFSVGIDIELIENFEKAADFRTHPFYIRNFSEKEISYCILQPNPIESFAGKFAAKEALIKCNNKFKKTPLNKIEILNDNTGKPYYKNFHLSISHTNNSAVAIAFFLQSPKSTPYEKEIIVEKKTISRKLKILTGFNLLLGVLTLTIVLLRIFEIL